MQWMRLWQVFFSPIKGHCAHTLSTTAHTLICNWNAFAKRENTFHAAFWRQSRARSKKEPLFDFKWSSRRLQLEISCLWLTDYDGWPRRCLWSVIEPPRARHLRSAEKKSYFKWGVINSVSEKSYNTYNASCKHSIFKWRVYNAFIIPTLVLLLLWTCAACNLHTVDGCLHAC